MIEPWVVSLANLCLLDLNPTDLGNRSLRFQTKCVEISGKIPPVFNENRAMALDCPQDSILLWCLQRIKRCTWAKHESSPSFVPQCCTQKSAGKLWLPFSTSTFLLSAPPYHPHSTASERRYKLLSIVPGFSSRVQDVSLFECCEMINMSQQLCFLHLTGE